MTMRLPDVLGTYQKSKREIVRSRIILSAK